MLFFQKSAKLVLTESIDIGRKPMKKIVLGTMLLVVVILFTITPTVLAVGDCGAEPSPSDPCLDGTWKNFPCQSELCYAGGTHGFCFRCVY